MLNAHPQLSCCKTCNKNTFYILYLETAVVTQMSSELFPAECDTHFPSSKQILCIFWDIHIFLQNATSSNSSIGQSPYFNLCFLTVQECQTISKYGVIKWE